MFGTSGRAGGRARGPERGQDVEAQLSVPFRVAALGGKVPIELEVNEECATCHGSGAAPGAKIQTCPECQGRGTISFGRSPYGSFAVPGWPGMDKFRPAMFEMISGAVEVGRLIRDAQRAATAPTERA